MGNKINLLGEKLFSWIIKSEYGNDGRGNSIWKCKCEYCGKEKIVRGQNFRNKQIDPCECIKFNEMAGKKFGKLTLIEIDHCSKKKQPYWLCKCECDKYKVIRESHIKDGNTISCGCHRIEYHQNKFRNKLVGKKFGFWTVLRFDHKVKGRIHWLCKCQCGTEKSVCGSALKKRKSLSCGCKNNISRGEEIIAEWFDKNNIKYNRQQTFKGCKLIKSLRFDFYLPDYNLCIEFQGKQHYEKTHKSDDLENTQKRDKIKRKFCKDNDIKLIEIPYWTKNLHEILEQIKNGAIIDSVNNSN